MRGWNRVKMVHDEALTGSNLSALLKPSFVTNHSRLILGQEIFCLDSWNEKEQFSGSLIMVSNEDTRDVKFYPVGFIPRNSPTQAHDQIATTLASCICNPTHTKPGKF